MAKEQVRAQAERLGLAVAAKPDSQDICFVPDGRYAGVIERLRPGAAEPGAIVDRAGRVLGRHEGIIHFTVGQRRGLGIAAPEPLYVLAVDAARREVVVGPQAALLRDRIFTGPLAWIGTDLPAPGEVRAVVARLRSSHPGAPGAARARGRRQRRGHAGGARGRHRAGAGLRALRRRPGAGRRVDHRHRPERRARRREPRRQRGGRGGGCVIPPRGAP